MSDLTLRCKTISDTEHRQGVEWASGTGSDLLGPV